MLPPKQAARLQAAKAVITVLGNLRLSFERFHSSARTYGVSKASYGWLAHRLRSVGTSGRFYARGNAALKGLIGTSGLSSSEVRLTLTVLQLETCFAAFGSSKMQAEYAGTTEVAVLSGRCAVGSRNATGLRSFPGSGEASRLSAVLTFRRSQCLLDRAGGLNNGASS